MQENANLKALLDEKYDLFNRRDFIENDPVSIPHQFTKKEDIEISAFLSATISWGNRKSIINNATRLLKAMDFSPFDFMVNYQDSDFKKLEGFVHRTFNDTDLLTFISCLQAIYKKSTGLEELFIKVGSMEANLARFPERFFILEPPQRTRKHIANIEKGSAAKRLNMFLRWMVRKDDRGVDFGIWTKISPSSLYIPLDVHTAKMGRQLGLLERKQNDWKAVVELTEALRKFDAEDPVKYDYALFGMGLSS